MEETETADSHVIHSLHPPSGGLYGLPYNPILYPPYGYPGYPDIRTPSYDAAHDGDIHVSKLKTSHKYTDRSGHCIWDRKNDAPPIL